MPRHRNIAAALTLLLIVALVIVPAIILAMALVQEATLFYAKVQTGEINFARMFAQFQASLPRWAAVFLERLGITNFAAVREMLSEGITSSFRTVATQALQIGPSALSLLMALGVMLSLTRSEERRVEKEGGSKCR